MKSFYDTFIKILRQAKGITREQIAQKLCITQAIYARLESEQTALTPNRAEKLPAALGISVHHLIQAFINVWEWVEKHQL